MDRLKDVLLKIKPIYKQHEFGIIALAYILSLSADTAYNSGINAFVRLGKNTVHSDIDTKHIKRLYKIVYSKT
ncbi:MAG: hypothetical protein Q4E07_03855, partial [Eubacteriales bacterium]|nr:hypothetical protein [Eubacteriales bacterium]